MARHAAIYARLSSERGDEDSVDLQVRRLRKEATNRGYTVPDDLVFEDHNRSATKRSGKRPAYDELVKALIAGKTSVVFVRETSRLYRRPMELEQLLELMEGRGLHIIPLFSSEQQLDQALERNDILTARIMVAVDAEEVAKLSKRVRQAKAARRAEGRHNGGGRRPFGYRRTAGGFELEPAEAQHIREAAARIIAGESLYRIVADWNDRGITTAAGNRWRWGALKPIFKGEAEKRGTPFIAGGGNWPAIITADEVAILRSRFDERSKLASKQPQRGRRYVLTGLLECAECHQPMSGTGRLYKCDIRNGGCGRVSIDARSLEDVIDRRVQQRREEGRAQDKVTTPVNAGNRPDLLHQLREVEQQVDSLADQLADAKTATARRVVDRAITKLAARQESLEAALGATLPETSVPSYADLSADDDLRDRWARGDLTATELTDLHEMFAAYFDRIRIAPRGQRKGTPRGSFDQSRVKVRWRR